jgi:TonB family protein
MVLLLCATAFAQEHKVGVNKYVIPKYPPIAVQARVYGDVVVDLKLDANGEVTSLQVANGHPMLRDAAASALRQWRFICLDCEVGKSFEHRFTLTFAITDAEGRNCELRVQRALLAFPNRLTIESGPPCVDTTSNKDPLPEVN